jgi:hypothetical protein
MKSRLVSVAQEGDETAARILDEPARNLASIVEAVLDKIGELPVYPTGGVFRAREVQGGPVELMARRGGHRHRRPRTPRRRFPDRQGGPFLRASKDRRTGIRLQLTGCADSFMADETCSSLWPIKVAHTSPTLILSSACRQVLIPETSCERRSCRYVQEKGVDPGPTLGPSQR